MPHCAKSLPKTINPGTQILIIDKGEIFLESNLLKFLLRKCVELLRQDFTIGITRYNTIYIEKIKSIMESMNLDKKL